MEALDLWRLCLSRLGTLWKDRHFKFDTLEGGAYINITFNVLDSGARPPVITFLSNRHFTVRNIEVVTSVKTYRDRNFNHHILPRIMAHLNKSNYKIAVSYYLRRKRRITPSQIKRVELELRVYRTIHNINTNDKSR